MSISDTQRGLLAHSVVALLLGGGMIAAGLARETPWVAALGVLFAATYAAATLPRRVRTLRAENSPVAPETRQVLEGHVSFYRALPESERDSFARRVTRLVHALDFEAVGEAEDDHAIRVLAVAGAAALLHGRPDVKVPLTRSVLLYADAFDEGYGVGHDEHIAGMVHQQGPVIFSDKALRRGWASDDDGYNVSVHEWAHVLDLDDGFADGLPGLTPPTGREGAPTDWDSLVDEELDRARRGRSQLRGYAGTNQAELFAVAAEMFIERPDRLRRGHEDLYEALCDALGRDPLEGKARPAKKRKPKSRNARKRARRARR